MSSFKEFLEDYEAREKEEGKKFDKRLNEGKLSEEDSFPPSERFIKSKHPFALYSSNIGSFRHYVGSCSPIEGSVWGVIPFYGSTVVKLVATKDKRTFDEEYKTHIGFTSTQIEEIISFIKETGRLQFVLSDVPTKYKNLDFLEPVFKEIKPPVGRRLTAAHLVGIKNFSRYNIEYETLAGFGLTRIIVEGIKEICGSIRMDSIERYTYDQTYLDTYIIVKHFIGEEIGEELGTLMILNPEEAENILSAVARLVTIPLCDHLKSIPTYGIEELVDSYESLERINTAVPTFRQVIPYDIGKFFLRKMVHYPETLDGCMEIIQKYDDYELYTVLAALNEGVKKKKIDIANEKRNNLSETLDNIWEDTNEINFKSAGINIGVSASFGLIGELASELSGSGILAMLGFQVADKIAGLKMDSISEKIAKFISPNYLITMYDFKKRHNIQK